MLDCFTTAIRWTDCIICKMQHTATSADKNHKSMKTMNFGVTRYFGKWEQHKLQIFETICYR